MFIISNELQEQFYLGQEVFQHIVLTGIFPLRSFKTCLTMMENSISDSMCTQSHGLAHIRASETLLIPGRDGTLHLNQRCE